MIGQTISHYKILEKLGEGGMGVVYKAEDVKLRRSVALKVLPRQVLSTDEDKSRFAREAQAAASLSHPNVCMIHEFDEVEGQAFIVMEYVDGQTVKRILQDRPLPITDAISVAIAVAEGLAKAHEKGIIHRDIKSDNVMISKDGVVKIMDFGLAEVAGRTRVTKEGMTVGTMVYMSPEQATGEKIDLRTDIWSLGVMLYEMVTGRLPFRGDYDQAVVYQILHEEPEPITSLRSNVSMELERIVNKAMQKNAGERYQHVDEMLVDLKAVQKKIGAGGLGGKTPERKLSQKKRRLLYAGIGIFVVIGLVLLYFFLPSKPVSVASKSIAVLPFKNLSDSKEDEYFSDGITEDIITHLANIGELKVISRTSTMQYKNSNKNLRDIGRELNVSTLLEGSVRRAGNQVRIVAQLIDANTDEHLWADTYDKELTQIFAIQSDVAQRVAEALKGALVSEERQQILKKPTLNTEAYDLYLRGRYYWNKRSKEGFLKSVQYFQKAIELDSSYTLAYAGLADAYMLMAYYQVTSPNEGFPQAKSLIEKTLTLDSTVAEGHASLGDIYFHYYRDWQAAEHHLRRAIELNPAYATAHHWYSECLNIKGLHEKAIAESKKAHELDPYSLIITTSVGWNYFCARMYNDAIAQYGRALELDSTFVVARYDLGMALAKVSQFDAAIQELNKATALEPDNPRLIGMLGHVYGLAGKTTEARKLLTLLKDSSSLQHVSAYDVAMVYLGLGNNQEAIDWLKKASIERSPLLPFIGVDPMFDALRSEPRFSLLLKKIGLEQ